MLECLRIGPKRTKIAGWNPTGRRTGHFSWAPVLSCDTLAKIWSAIEVIAVYWLSPGGQNGNLGLFAS